MFFSAKIRWVGERQAGGGHAVRKKERERVRSGREFVQGESSSSERVCSGREFVQVESSFRERVRPVREFVQGESSFRERGKEKGGQRERETESRSAGSFVLLCRHPDNSTETLSHSSNKLPSLRVLRVN